MADGLAMTDVIDGGVHAARLHDSARKHAEGTAVYIDDMPEPQGLLHVYIAMSAKAHARIAGLDVSRVRAAPGVACVLTASDVPGINDASPLEGDDPVFADGLVEYVGQSLFAVAAGSLAEARAAAALAKVEYRERDALLTVDAAMAAGAFVLPPTRMRPWRRCGARASAACASPFSL